MRWSSSRKICCFLLALLLLTACGAHSYLNQVPSPLPPSLQSRAEQIAQEVRRELEAGAQGSRIAALRPLTDLERAEIDAEIPAGCPRGTWGLVVLDVKFKDGQRQVRYGRIIVPEYCDLDLLSRKGTLTAVEYRTALEAQRGKKGIAVDLMDFFVENFNRQDYLPIQSLIPYHYFEEEAKAAGLTADELSMRCNNSYAFAPRQIRDTGHWSMHVFGALDLNPFFNPAITVTALGKQEGRRIENVSAADVLQGRAQVEPATALRFAFSREEIPSPYAIKSAWSPVVQFFSVRGWKWGGSFVTMRDYQHFEVAK